MEPDSSLFSTTQIINSFNIQNIVLHKQLVMSRCGFLDDILQAASVPRRSFGGQQLDPEDYQLDPNSLASLAMNFTSNLHKAHKEKADITMTNEKANFIVKIKVNDFKPEEINVKVVGENSIVVEGKHEEREDEFGFVSRQFTRRFVIPSEFDIGLVKSKLNDGVLIVTAPRRQGADNGDGSIEIPIQVSRE